MFANDSAPSVSSASFSPVLPASGAAIGEVAALQPVTFADLVDTQPATAAWLWHGYLARGNVTLLTSQWKSGKTTLLAVLMTRFRTGGELAGLAVQPARTVIVSEETPALWRARGERLDFGPHARFLCRPFVGKPTFEQWFALINRLVALQAEHALDLVVFDPLSAFLPAGAENHSDLLLHALRPLERLTQTGLAVALLHHPKKGGWRPGQAARGSGALGGFADVMIEMNRLPDAAADDRRRQLSAWSRHDETPRERFVELSVDGLDYQAFAPSAEPAIDVGLERGLEVIVEVLLRHGRMMTRHELCEGWPERPKPSPATMWRWLDHGVMRSLLTREGAGKRINPFRYGVTGHDLRPPKRSFYDEIELNLEDPDAEER